MSTLFTGYYGKLNIGDDAFCVISDWGARKYWEQKDIRFSGQNLPKGLDGQKLLSSPRKKQFKGQYYFEYLKEGFKKSNIVYAGGSIFHSKIPTISRENIFSLFNKVSSKKLGAIGVSLGPFKEKGDYESIKKYLDLFSFIALRDKSSFEIAKKMNLKADILEAFDLAALLPIVFPISKTSFDYPVLGVSLCYYERFTGGLKSKEENRIERTINCVNTLMKKIPDLRVRFLEFNGDPFFGDFQLLNSAMERMNHKDRISLIRYDSDTYQMWEAISDCSVVLSTRLHA